MKMKSGWADLPRMSKLASALYPNLVPPERRKEMDAIARGEGKKLSGPKLLSDAERGAVSKLGGTAVGWPEPKKGTKR